MSFPSTGWWWLAGVVVVVAVFAAWVRARRGRTDIEWPTLDPDLKWDPPAADSLGKLYAYVVKFSDATIGWYQTRRWPKRRWGVFMRLGAIVLGVTAGLVPISEQLGMGMIPPAWSTVMLAAAGLFVTIDSFFGFTSGWVRYMLAQQKVERAKDIFLMEWNALKVAKADDQTQLERAKTFLLTVGRIVDDETQEWATEFQSALKEMEKARKEAAEVQRTGALEVTVKNPSAVTEWTLEIDGSQRGRTSGKSLAVTDVAVGVRKLRVFGEDAQKKRLSDEKTVKVEGGAVAAKEMELS